jgi:hypothetical protein
MTSKQEEMPPLPQGKYTWWNDYYSGLTLSDEPEDRYRQLGLYDEDQMRSHAAQCVREAVERERERCAALCESTGAGFDNEWNRRLGVVDDLRDVAEECAAAIREQK